MPVDRIVSEVRKYAPDAVLLGHSGSTSAHPIATRIARAVRAAWPHAWIVYGGVFPSFHWPEIMEQEPEIDFIVRGEGEETVVRLTTALERGGPLDEVPGIVFRAGTVPNLAREAEEPMSPEPGGRVLATPPAPVIQDLDAQRVGWELIDLRRYTYWGNRRAVVAQFSRGCPHQCLYCGQRDFWRSWRHRDPVKFAAELARLHREHGVEVVNFADENPTASRPAWQAFLEALIAQHVPLILVGSTRAGDIVRDADILPLYKQAGVARFLLGIESTDERTLQAIRKGSTQAIDREAIRLLREHGIISMAAWVAGFAREKDRDYWRTLRQILSYDPDQIQAVYATPHRWTAFGRQEANRRVVQTDLSLWDYKHQVLESEHLPNWRVLCWMKLIEAVSQLRPKSLFRLLAHPDRGFRAAMRWYYGIGRRVWLHEMWHWLFCDRRTVGGPTLAEFQNGGWATGPAGSPRLSLRQAELRKMRRSNAEWDFMGRSFLVWSLVNMGLREPQTKDQYLPVIDQIIRETVSIEQQDGIYANLELSWQTAAMLGVTHLLLYVGFILLVPVFLITAILLMAWNRWMGRTEPRNQAVAVSLEKTPTTQT